MAKLKAGDTARVVDSSSYHTKKWFGVEGTIISVDESMKYPYSLEFNDDSCSFSEEELELVNELKKGDRVRVSTDRYCSPNLKQNLGTIESIKGDWIWVKVGNRDADLWQYYLSEITVLDKGESVAVGNIDSAVSELDTKIAETKQLLANYESGRRILLNAKNVLTKG